MKQTIGNGTLDAFQNLTGQPNQQRRNDYFNRQNENLKNNKSDEDKVEINNLQGKQRMG